MSGSRGERVVTIKLSPEHDPREQLVAILAFIDPLALWTWRADCAERALKLAREWECETHPDSWAAVDAVRAYARGEIRSAELETAAKAAGVADISSGLLAHSAAVEAASLEGDPLKVAALAAGARAFTVYYAADDAAPEDDDEARAWVAAHGDELKAAARAEIDAETDWQLGRLCELIVEHSNAPGREGK